MTLNLTELRDEPLGKHPGSLTFCAMCMPVRPICSVTETVQDVVAADHERSFTFDVDCLSDEALDHDAPSYLAVCGGPCMP